ncbi:hypothetical protein K435DRAFT_781968 [Dendrothele bispora CBS 962.96]|uniref:F-box domain-containing protein n=1 Tax=Dendrothele bispora (strain CBS 962.96) TaxID=1314807 RepID=A0A4S8LHQ4_DENBC|nr:hypothetical protein K435DRAFT_781968 [Dendrothele bispora CBS 962.96]
MHATLRIPELLRSIFENSDRKDNIQNALVCKQWSDISLDVVWRDVHMRDLPAFFNLLAPVKSRSIARAWSRDEIDISYDFEFERDPDVNDWGRFCTRYCPRVRRLLLDYREVRGKNLTRILMYLRFNRPAKPLLPKLTELTCHYSPRHSSYFGPLDSLFVFMHEDLQRISISMHFYTKPDASAFFKLLPLQSPNLTHLEFRCARTVSSHSYDEALIECLAGLPSLSTVVLPSIPDGSSIFTGLKSLKRFELCSFNDNGSAAIENPMKHPLQSGAPYGLEHLHLTVRYDLATASLLAQSELSDLTSIDICSPLMESPDAIKQLSSAIAKTCPNVERVHLIFNPRSIPDSELNRSLPSSSLPSFSDIRPLLQCNRINDLKFTHFYALAYTSLDQPVSLLRSFPNLKSLVLNPYGHTSASGKSRLSATVLLKLAEAVPNIECIGMRFTVATLPSDQELFTQGNLPYILRSLQTLDVGRSRLRDGDEVRTAFFLSGILPRGCKILSHSSSTETDPSTLKGWNGVQRLLPQVIERAKLMNKTVDRLKESSSALKTVEEKLNESLSSNAILEQKLLELTQELKEEREKNSSFSVGPEESMDEEQLPSFSGSVLEKNSSSSIGVEEIMSEEQLPSFSGSDLQTS